MFLKKLWNKIFDPKPFNEGYLPMVDGHEIWFAEYGNPHGKPILLTHGGPGGSCKVKHIKDFDLSKYRIIMFDQRGCGNSRPFGELKHNTTNGILFDMERLLDFLNIKEKVIIRGGSWASTIALLFAERNPEKVDKLLLSQIFLANEMSEKWEQEQCSLFYPDMLEQLRQPINDKQNIPEFYLRQLTSSDTEKQKKSLETYGYFERVLGALSPHWDALEEIDEKSLACTQIYAQYAVEHHYIKDNEILNNAKKIKHIPTLIVHNRLDMLCPLLGAYELAKNFDNCKLVVVPERGHIGKLLYKTFAKEARLFLEN